MGKINLTLIGLVVALSLALGLLVKVAWDKRELDHANSALNEQLMQARLDIGRAETKFGDADKYAKDLEKALEEEIKNRNAQVTLYGELEAKYQVLKKKKGKTKIVYVPSPDNGIQTDNDQFRVGMIYMAVGNGIMLPLTEITHSYSDYMIHAKCISLPVPNDELAVPYEFQYKLDLNLFGQLVETNTPSGAVNHYLNLWSVDKNGKKKDKLKISKFSVVVSDERSPRFYWWAPHLDVGLVGGMDTSGKFRTGGTIGISAMGYGLTNNDLSWRFVRLGMDAAARPGVSFDPVMYNLGEHIPLISNLWISPHVVRLFNAEWLLGIMLGAVL